MHWSWVGLLMLWIKHVSCQIGWGRGRAAEGFPELALELAATYCKRKASTVRLGDALLRRIVLLRGRESPVRE